MRPLILSSILLLGLLGTAAHAQAPVPGQPYAIPQGYDGYPPGSLIAYGGYNYVIQDNATMLLAASQDASGTDDGTTADDSVPVDITAYQIPPGYDGSSPGSQISYGGNDYTVMSDGTMMMSNPGYSIADGTQYQIPPDFSGADAGSVVSYGGSDYLIGAGGMIKINVNVGFGTKPNPGKPGSSITRPGTNNHPGSGGSNRWVTQRPQYPGTPGTAGINQGTVHPGWTNTGVVHPQNVHPGPVSPGWANRGPVNPGWANTGLIHPQNVHPGQAHPGPVSPGWANHGPVHAGSFNGPVGHPGGGGPRIGGGRIGHR